MEVNNKKKFNRYIWVEKFRPQKVVDIVLPKQYNVYLISM